MSDLVETTALPTAPAFCAEDAPRAFKRLTYRQVRLVRDLAREGTTQAEIAQVVGSTQQNISYCLRHLAEDTTDLAQDVAKASAYRRARRLDAWSRNRDKIGLDAAKQLDAIAGLGQNSSPINNFVGIQIGVGQAPELTERGAKVTIVQGQTFASPQNGPMNTGLDGTKV